MLTTMERELDYYRQKVNMPIVPWVAGQLKGLRNLEISSKFLKYLEFMRKYSAGHPKDKFRQLCYKIANNKL